MDYEDVVSEEIEETGERKRHKNDVVVKVLSLDGSAAVVEYLGNDNSIKRVSIPKKSVKDNKVDEETLDAGIIFGENWTEIVNDVGIGKEALAENINNALHKRGIWTYADALANIGAVRASVVECSSFITSAIINHAHKRRKVKK